MYTGTGGTSKTDVADAAAVCGAAMSFSVDEAQENWWNGGFFYGQEQNLVTEPGKTYRMSMRYRSTEDRNVYWRVIDRPVGTFGGEADIELISTTLAATTTYQDYSAEFTASDTATVPHSFFFLGMMADNTAPVFIDDFVFEEVDEDTETCEEGPYNDPSFWSSYASSGVQQVVGEVPDELAVCENAIRAKLQQLETTPFQAGLQINQAQSPEFLGNSDYRVRFRYRADEPRTIYYRMVPRAPDNSAGGPGLFAQDLAATPTYQQFDTIVSSRGDQDSILYQLWMNGDNLAAIYIDDFSIERVGGACLDEDEVYNDLGNYSSYGPIDKEVVVDEDAACNDAFRVKLREVQSGAFGAGFEVRQTVALPDRSGDQYTISFDYRANQPRTVPIIITSRQRGTFGSDSGPQYHYEELQFTETYQQFSHTFISTVNPDSLNRIIHVALALGLDTTTVYIDNISMERVVPDRTERMTLYVHPDGSDDNPGDSLSPDRAYRTMRFALNQLIPGDSLLVADGVYAENNLRVLNVRGSEDAVTVIKSINPWGAKIEGDIRYNINLQVENSAHIVVEGFEIYSTGRSNETNLSSGLQIFGSDYVRLENNYVHDCGCGGISGRESDYMTIQRNVARDNAKYSPFNCSGISIYQPRMLDQEEGVHILIKDNVSFENEVRLAFAPLGFSRPTDGNGIILDDFNNTQSFSNEPNTTPAYVAETVVENNLVFRNGGSGIKTFEVQNVTIRNNTSYHNNYVLEEFTSNTAEIGLQVLGGEALIYNNLMVERFGSRGQAFSSQTVEEGEVVMANNIAVGGVVFNGREPQLMENTFVTEDRQSFPQFAQLQDSLFFDTFAFTSVDDFKQFFGLREGSPAIDAGANDLAPAADLNGVERPINAIVDVGAYEGAVEGVGPLPDDERLRGFAVSTPNELTVDGVKDGLYTGVSEPITKVIAGEVMNRADLSATWTAAYTPQNLYLYVSVMDDSLYEEMNATENYDGIELFFDADNAAGDTYDANDRYFTIPYGAGMVLNQNGGSVDNIDFAFAEAQDGYTVEVVLPWDLLDVATPADSLILGFDVQVMDADGVDAFSQVAWAANDTTAVTDPSKFGELQLIEVDAPPIIPGTTDSIAIDGVIDAAYAEATVYPMLNEVQPGISDSLDFSANWRAVWDTSGMYVIVDVVDDVLVNDSENWYEDDGVEIYIDAGNEKASNYDGNDHQIVIEYDAAVDTIYDTKGNLGAGAVSAIVTTENGYTVEAYIPWTALSISPNAGTFIGLDVHGIDDDRGEGGNDGKLAWFATIDESFKNPSLFGTVLLGNLPTSIRGLPEAGDWLSVNPNPTSGVLRYQFDGFRNGTLRLHDFQGRLLQSQTVRASAGELQLGNLPNGVYLLTVSDGKEWARQRIVIHR